MPSLFLATSSAEFQREAEEELQKLDPEIVPGEILEAGLFLFSTSLDPETFYSRLAEGKTIYTRHLFRVMETLDLAQKPEVLKLIAETAAQLAANSGFPPSTPFSVQARIVRDGQDPMFRPLALKEAIVASAIPATGWVENIKGPEIIISLAVTPSRAYLGVSRVEQNLSAWAGGMRHYAQTPQQISRAEFKLLEALEVFNLKLVPGNKVLDLGAAPGGWTRILLEAGLQVTAVDPASLDPRLIVGPNLVHFRGYSEDFLKKAVEKAHFDLILNDMRMDAIEAARLLPAFSPLLNPNGFIISTLKLPHATRKLRPSRVATRALSELENSFKTVRARQLFHNRQEITVFLKDPV